MSADEPSARARAMTWLAIAACVALLAWGGFRYGWSMEAIRRFWIDIFDRLDGPMAFRFLLQPLMALLLALPDGIKDARRGHKSFVWSTLREPDASTGRLRQGLIMTARAVLLGLGMDAIYQYRVLDRFYPGEAVAMALLLAVIPYFLFRWGVECIANWWFARGTA